MNHTFIPAGILWVSQDSSGLRLLLQNIAPFHICRGLGSKSYDHLIHAYLFIRPFVQELKSFPPLTDVGGGENGSFCSEWGQGCPVTSPESSQLGEVS